MLIFFNLFLNNNPNGIGYEYINLYETGNIQNCVPESVLDEMMIIWTKIKENFKLQS